MTKEFKKNLRRIQVNYHCTAVPRAGIPEIKKGATTRIECNEKGVPLEQYWRRRCKDAEIDNCITFIDDLKKETKTVNKKGSGS